MIDTERAELILRVEDLTELVQSLKDDYSGAMCDIKSLLNVIETGNIEKIQNFVKMNYPNKEES